MDDNDEDSTSSNKQCQVCRSGDVDDDDPMLLCDACNEGYHISCLNPPLARVPDGNWFCDNCMSEANEGDV